MRVLAALFALLILAFGPAVAQDQPPTGAAAPAPAAAEQVTDTAGANADAAVREWLSRATTSILPSASMSAEEICRQLPNLVGSRAAPPAGTEVRIEDRVERPSDDPAVRIFTYAAVRPLDTLDVVEVRLRRAEPISEPADEPTTAPRLGTESAEGTDGAESADATAGAAEEWTVEFVGFRSTLELTGVRAWLQTPTAWWLFTAFSLLVLIQLLTRGSLLRRWLVAGRQVIGQHRRLVIITMALLYGAFGMGALLGSALPDECEAAIVEVVTNAVTSLGATEAYSSGNVARAAVTTFYQNFVVVTVSVTFTLAAILGVPAYLYAIFSFFVQGVPFGLLGGGPLAQLLVLLIVILLELTSYFLVVAGGGMLLATVWRRGFGQLGTGFRKLLLMLPIAMVLLTIGAWFEAAALILGF